MLLASTIMLPLLALQPVRFLPVSPLQGFKPHVKARSASLCAILHDDFLAWVENKLALRRMEFSRPKRIILVRHGLSEGNVDSSAYSRTPDSQIALTERGFAQATVAGLQIRQLVGNESVRFFYSPYLRARQTMLGILQAFNNEPVQISSEPRLREQDFGNFQDPAQMYERMKERQHFGRFYFRFPNGEAGTDVYDRMASFITFLFRTMGDKSYAGVPGERGTKSSSGPVQNYILVTHGLLMRIFCMCYLRWTVSEFEQASMHTSRNAYLALTL